jgi:hypothetical protein
MSLVSSPLYTGPALLKGLYIDTAFDATNAPYRSWQIGFTTTRQTEVLDVPVFTVPGATLLMDSSFQDDTPQSPTLFPAFYLGPDNIFTHDMVLNYPINLDQFSVFLTLAHSAFNLAETVQGFMSIYTGVDPTTMSALMAG